MAPPLKAPRGRRHFAAAPRLLVTDDDRKRYREDGVVCVRGAFSAEWLSRLSVATDAAIDASSGNTDLEEYTRTRAERGRFCAEMDCSRKYAEFQHFVFESPAAELIASLLGSSQVSFFYDILFVKEPDTAQRTGWHQDKGYWLVEGEDVCSIWLPLDPVPRASCLEFVRGSHREDVEYAPFRFADDSTYRGAERMPRVPDIEARREDYDIVGFDMAPGDCLMFDYRMLHSAPPVAPGAPRRRAFSTRWLGDGARFSRTAKCAQSQESGYPNYDCGLQDGDPLWRSAAFPVMWPRDSPERPAYAGLDAARAAAGRGEALQLQPPVAGDFAEVRRRQAQVYSLDAV